MPPVGGLRQDAAYDRRKRNPATRVESALRGGRGECAARHAVAAERLRRVRAAPLAAAAAAARAGARRRAGDRRAQPHVRRVALALARAAHAAQVRRGHFLVRLLGRRLGVGGRVVVVVARRASQWGRGVEPVGRRDRDPPQGQAAY